MKCVQTEKPRPVFWLLSSLDRWKTWGWKARHPIQPLPRNTWLSCDSNTGWYNSKTWTPPYRICCLVPLCSLIASLTYHFTMRKSSRWDAELLCFRWYWLLPHYLHCRHSDSHQRASPKCLGFYQWAFQKDSLTVFSPFFSGLDDASLKFCLYSVFTTQQVRRNSLEQSRNAMTFLPSL